MEPTNAPKSCNNRELSKNNKLDPTDFNWRIDSRVKKTNYPRFLIGNRNTAIILIHGFIASPFEVSALGKSINEYDFPVLLPLIDGFGGSTELANSSSLNNWKATLRRSIEFLEPCYSNFILIGFSLGGSLITDLALEQEIMQSKNNRTINISALILLAPYYKAGILGGNLLNDFFKVFTNSISLKTVFRFSQNPDLLIPISNPEHYNNEMPLNAVSEIYELSNQITQIYSKVISDIPTFLVITDDDKTIDYNFSKEFVFNHFKNVKLKEYEKNEKVKHQLVLPQGNKHYSTLCAEVVEFLFSNISH